MIHRCFLFIGLFSLLTCTAIAWSESRTRSLIEQLQELERLQNALVKSIEEVEELEHSIMGQAKISTNNAHEMQVVDDLEQAFHNAQIQQHQLIHELEESERLRNLGSP